MKPIKAVIFDIDGTLVNRKAAFLKLCEFLIEKYGEDYPYKGTKTELLEYLIEIDANGYGGLHMVIPKLKNRWELPLTIQEFIRERNEIFGKLTVPFEETYEVLNALKGKYKLGVITNGYSQVQRQKIKTVGIENYFEDIIVSGEEDFEKPHPGIFKLACAHLGVREEEAVYVGDYFPNDIAGALSAQLTPIWICDNPEEHSEYQGLRVSRLRDILDYL